MLTLVVGGSASGKSAFAERLAVQSGLPRFYVATMRVWDAESEKRVARHRAMRREKRFETLECPLHLEKLDMPARGTALLEDMGFTPALLMQWMRADMSLSEDYTDEEARLILGVRY